jgi:Family of unknown function (DUF6282)
VNSNFLPARFRKLTGVCIGLFVLVTPALSQSELNLAGAIDTRVHTSPDNVARSIDADDLARIAEKSGMRGLVLTNHWEATDALAYMVRKEVPGIEIFGGVEMDQSVGGINLETVKRMTMMKGSWGRVVWLPTFDAVAFTSWVKKDGKGKPYSTTLVPISRDGRLLPSVLDLIDFIAQHHELLLETGHNSAQEVLMVVHEARQRGVLHIVVTGAMDPVVKMTIPQMRQAAQEGAYIEFAYSNAFGSEPEHTMSEFAEAIRAVGPQFCILSTNFVDYPSHPHALLDFMEALHKEGISVPDINLMSKVNPALALGLKP